MMENNTNIVLIADSGSTKTDWLLLKGNKEFSRFSTQGINPFMLNELEIVIILTKELPQLPECVEAIYFYGAGCRGEQSAIVKSAIKRVFPTANIQVESDLLGAARSVCGNESGIACILGTGSNSCLYDGKNIVENVFPLGYILGDEGSGAVMGKHLVADILKHQMPDKISTLFFEKYQLTPDQIIQRVYREPFPNRFLATFALFIGENRNNPDIHKFIIYEFECFFRRNVDQYHRPNLPINFVGSIAFFLRIELQEVAKSLGYRIGRIYRTPLDGLMKYHTAHNKAC